MSRCFVFRPYFDSLSTTQSTTVILVLTILNPCYPVTAAQSLSPDRRHPITLTESLVPNHCWPATALSPQRFFFRARIIYLVYSSIRITYLKSIDFIQDGEDSLFLEVFDFVFLLISQHPTNQSQTVPFRPVFVVSLLWYVPRRPVWSWEETDVMGENWTHTHPFLSPSSLCIPVVTNQSQTRVSDIRAACLTVHPARSWIALIQVEDLLVDAWNSVKVVGVPMFHVARCSFGLSLLFYGMAFRTFAFHVIVFRIAGLSQVTALIIYIWYTYWLCYSYLMYNF